MRYVDSLEFDIKFNVTVLNPDTPRVVCQSQNQKGRVEMGVEKTDVEKLFDELSAIAYEAGFALEEIRAIRRPTGGGAFSEYRVRSQSRMNRVVGATDLIDFFGG